MNLSVPFGFFGLKCLQVKVMETLKIEIIEPKAKKILEDLEDMDLIKVEKNGKQENKERKFGSMKGLVVEIADDFDAPLEDFEDYM